MKLGIWLDKEKIAPSEFARRINRTAETVRRYVGGDRIPDRDTMPLVVEQTAGAVLPNDFYDLRDIDHACFATSSDAAPSSGNTDYISTAEVTA